MSTANVVQVDGRAIPIEGERNLLELIRKGGVDLPTFCYHSELSVYGACRLCLVDIEGRGILGACSTPPEPGMKLRTNTDELREIRKISVELLLANHNQSCPTCHKSDSCQLQMLARQLGVRDVRFKPVHAPAPVDLSSQALLRDPNKCVLCGDCVRMCSEIQSVGAIDFAYRGHDAAVVPAFGRGLGEVECVDCGQCARVCPTGALAPRPEIEEVWAAIDNPRKTVVAQIAPAVRVALGECFGLPPGSITVNQMVAALKTLGFDQVYDTSFAADLTVFEEGTELLARKARGGKLPLFTSCCPAWVKFAEFNFPDLLGNLSTCRSPQQMFGSLLKEALPEQLNVAREDVVVVSAMPCTAKKSEAKRPEFTRDGAPDVDHVITTVELAQMIRAAGIRFHDLEPQAFDMPFSFATGAGVIFGSSGGVTEAVLRFVASKLGGTHAVDFREVRGEGGMRESTVQINGTTLKVVVVHGLRNARAVAESVRAGTADWDVVEVMACPGGCSGGAGQPVQRDAGASSERAKGLYRIDKMMQLQRSQDNVFVSEIYTKWLGEPNSPKAHDLLHTHYQSHRRLDKTEIPLVTPSAGEKQPVNVCLGTNCFLKGSEGILRGLLRHAGERGGEDRLDIRASFCMEHCECSPTVRIDGQIHAPCSLEEAAELVDERLERSNGRDVDRTSKRH